MENFTTTAENILYSELNKQVEKEGTSLEISCAEYTSLIKLPCKYCGKVGSLSKKIKECNNLEYRYNIVTREDLKYPYVLDNTITVCSTCFESKNNKTHAEFLDYIKQVYTHSFVRLAEKTPGIVVDELFTTLYKLWWEQEKVMHGDEKSEEVLIAAKKTQELNAKRNRLIRTLDDLLGFSANTFTAKTYAEIEKNLEK